MLCSLLFFRRPGNGQVRKPSNPECYTLSSEPITICLKHTSLHRYIHGLKTETIQESFVVGTIQLEACFKESNYLVYPANGTRKINTSPRSSEKYPQIHMNSKMYLFRDLRIEYINYNKLGAKIYSI
jgi:hypothetical protein